MPPRPYRVDVIHLHFLYPFLRVWDCISNRLFENGLHCHYRLHFNLLVSLIINKVERRQPRRIPSRLVRRLRGRLRLLSLEALLFRPKRAERRRVLVMLRMISVGLKEVRVRRMNLLLEKCYDLCLFTMDADPLSYGWTIYFTLTAC